MRNYFKDLYQLYLEMHSPKYKTVMTDNDLIPLLQADSLTLLTRDNNFIIQTKGPDKIEYSIEHNNEISLKVENLEKRSSTSYPQGVFNSKLFFDMFSDGIVQTAHIIDMNGEMCEIITDNGLMRFRLWIRPQYIKYLYYTFH